MPDIAMCKGVNERICQSCYKKLAIPNEYRQSYFMQIPITKEGKCDEWMSSVGRSVGNGHCK